MEHENKKEQGRFMGNGFEPTPNNSMGDWGGSDGFSMWDSAEDAPEGLLKDWEGSHETHEMFNDSYD
ncbi:MULTISPECIES: hypothetical protein [Paenibacillus]|uniref:hypothetical protein n=1 Tax=Paenibacillus TaxID=44249 RepID=UPI00096C908B|nr:hypothetical protein [Paenibacillus odorifer]OMD85382.1 hypothetical protein BSK67_29150 [Paenibacillus odorifer]